MIPQFVYPFIFMDMWAVSIFSLLHGAAMNMHVYVREQYLFSILLGMNSELKLWGYIVSPYLTF